MNNKCTTALLLFVLFHAGSLFAETTGVRAAYSRGGMVGAHNIAMGNAVEAITDDVFAIYWNPAGLSKLRRKKPTINQDVRLKLKKDEIDKITERDLELFSDTTPKFFFQIGASASLMDSDRELGFSGAAFNIYDLVLGVGAYGVNSSEIPTYDSSGESTGMTDYRAGISYFSFAYPTEFVSFGASAKVFYEDIDSTHYAGLGSDVGIQTDFIPLVQLGIVAQDLGTGLRTIEESEEYSNDYDYGKPVLRMNVALASRTSDIILSMGLLRKFENEDLEYKLGFLYNISPQTAFLLGVRSSLFSTGLKINLWSLDLSYALSVDNIDFGYNHTASVLFMF